MRIIAICFLLFPVMLKAQIGAKVQQQGGIIGIWQNSQFGYQMTLILNADGNGEFDGESIRFTTQANKLSITQSGVTMVYTYALQGSTLTLSGGDLEETIAFTKAGSGAKTETVVTNQTNNTSATGGSGSNELVGVWSGNGEAIEFKSNGQCIYLGNTFSYEVSQGHIILKTGQGNAMFAYTIEGHQLHLTANGNKVSYSKGAGNSAVATTKNSTGGSVAQELVGKWCWTNTTTTNSGGSSSSECIVLNANGTYEYASERSMDTNTNAFYAGTSSQGSDRGTWWVQGDRVFYNSQTRGQGSYQLQKINHPKTGDPMIVLDGEPYVTFYQKQPWR
jgi:hypothetical protein